MERVGTDVNKMGKPATDRCALVFECSANEASFVRLLWWDAVTYFACGVRCRVGQLA